VHQVCAESYAVRYMHEYSMTVVIQIDSSRALTALSYDTDDITHLNFVSTFRHYYCIWFVT
jgi:hypothetical protein